jgi:hypothetical protein
MTAKLVKIPDVGNARPERFKMVFPGHHTLEEVIFMAMKGVGILEHDHGIFRTASCDFWVSPINEDGDALTTFSNGLLIAKHKLIIDSPYQCAADHYRA